MATKTSASERMSRTLVQLARRKGRLPALVTSVGIAAYLTLKSLLNLLLGWVTGSGYAAVMPSQGGDAYPMLYLGQIPQQLLVTTLPFCLGIFLALWLIAPLAEQLTLAFVLTRGALAAAAGAIIVLVVNFVIALISAFSRLTDTGNLRFDNQPFDPQVFFGGAINAVSTGAGMFIAEIVAVLFASVLLWLWLREHPREYTVSGLIDEV